MINRRSALILNISSPGATNYVFNAAYRTTKARLDKLTSDMAHDLHQYNVAVVSLWTLFAQTEKYMAHPERYDLSRARSPEFTGRAVGGLANDSNVMEKTGRVLRVRDIADEYGFAE